MKVFAICSSVGVLVFGMMGFQMGFLKVGSGPIGPGLGEEAKKPRAKFPQDLAPAGRAQPVPVAAEFDAKAEAIPLVIMKANGQLHPWHEKVRQEWQAETVEATQLVVVVGPQLKSKVSTEHFQQGPPIERHQYDVEVSVVLAKTGKVVANQVFRNSPRPIRNWELLPQTMIGEPVQLKTVFTWVEAQARSSFPKATGGNPIVTVVQ